VKPLSDRDRIEPDPLPVPAGRAPFPTVAPGGPPDGLEFLGARETVAGWLLPCPCCCQGWVPLAARGGAYELHLSIGCTRGCDPAYIAWWHSWRLGEIPPRLAEDRERAYRYARGAIRRVLAGLPPNPSERSLRGAAYAAGRWAEAGGLPAGPVATHLIAAARRAGLNPEAVAPKLARAFKAGRAVPGRIPA
jgi:hypothetical protein